MQLRLRQLRLNRRLTQRELADRIGCSVGAYSKYETGEREPSIATLSAIADFYEVSLGFSCRTRLFRLSGAGFV